MSAKISKAKINKLIWKITLQKPNTEKDDQGGRKRVGIGWLDVATVWADFRVPLVKEMVATGTTLGELTREIIIHKRSDVARGWQVKQGTKIFSIKNVFDFDLTTTVLVCQEVTR